MHFDPVYIPHLRKGDTILAPTSPGFRTAVVIGVRRERNTTLVDIVVENRVTNGAWVEFGTTGNALVLRPEGATRPVGDERR